jgi:hypothetical protein
MLSGGGTQATSDTGAMGEAGTTRRRSPSS